MYCLKGFVGHPDYSFLTSVRFFTLLQHCVFASLFSNRFGLHPRGLKLLKNMNHLHLVLITVILLPPSFLQALLCIISFVLYWCGQKEHLCFLVLSLVLSWINLLYFCRGSRHMGIYSVMIQKVPVPHTPQKQRCLPLLQLSVSSSKSLYLIFFSFVSDTDRYFLVISYASFWSTLSSS